MSVQIIPLGFLPSGAPVLLNGLADGGGFLFAGTASPNTLHRIDFNGNLISSINAPGRNRTYRPSNRQRSSLARPASSRSLNASIRP